MQSSQRLEREAGRNVEVMGLTGKLAPDFKTIADFRRDHGSAIRAACAQFVVLCRQLGLLTGGSGYFSGEAVRACEEGGIMAIVPKPLTSSGMKRGFFAKQDFVFDTDRDLYLCPAGQELTRARSDRIERATLSSLAI